MRPATLLICIGAVVFANSGRVTAQPALTPKDGKVIVSMTVHSADAAKPISRNYLLPEYKDSIPGNQVQMYLRLFMEQAVFFGPEESKKREKWNTSPLAELPADELKDYGRRLLSRDAVDATRMLDVDWQLWHFLRRDGFYTVLPDVQKMRSVAEALKTRVRGQIRNGDADGAIETLRTLFALAHSFQEHPTLIGQLVGIAIGNIACEAAEELVQLPNCPNLIWSFTDLPRPFMNLRLGLQGEIPMSTTQFKSVLEGVVTDAELARVVKQADEVVAMSREQNSKGEKASARYKLWAADPKRVEVSRKRLVETGLKADLVKSFSPLQAIVADDVQQSVVFTDDLFKSFNLPFWQAIENQEAVEAAVKANTDLLILGPELAPAALKVKRAQVRLDQRIAYLRVIEAIRLNSHEHGAGLPATLNDLKVPLPVDPVSGKSFSYTVKDGVATLTGVNPNPKQAETNRVYEIRIAK
jgi:hypothetical protein